MIDKRAVLDRLDPRVFYKKLVPSLKENGNGQAMGLCPLHDDHKSSLSVNLKTAQFNCFGCDKKGSVFDFYMLMHGVGFKEAKDALAREVGLITEPAARIDRTYDYRDETGTLLFQVVKYLPKAFSLRKPDGRGGWTNTVRDVRLAPYRLEEIQTAETVFIVEGEKDVENLRNIGLAATCNPMGAGKWRADYNKYFRGKSVVVVPDNDEPGEAHASNIASELSGHASSVKVVDLPGLRPKGDISDWIQNGGTRETLMELVKMTSEWNRPGPSNGTLTNGNSRTSDRHRFNLIEARDILSGEEPEEDWILEGVLPAGGLSLLVSKPKVGKTTLALNLAVAVSRGTDFLGRKTRQGPVVYLALEEKKSEIKKKLAAMGVQDEPLYFHIGPAPADAMTEIEEVIKERKPVLLIIDILQKFCRCKDLNDYAEVTNTLDPLMVAARKLKCHILISHHAGKRERTDGDDILGSTGLLGGVDTSIHIKKRDKESRTITSIQRYGEGITEIVVSLAVDCTLKVEGSREEVEIQETLPLVLEVLDGGTQTEKEIWGKTEKRHDIVSKALRRLCDEGRVRRGGAGKRGDPFVYEKDSLLSLPTIYAEGRERNEEQVIT